MTIILIAFLIFTIVALLVWVVQLKKSLKEHFLIESALHHEIGHDELTGLVNASLLIDRLRQSIKSAMKYKTKIAVLYLRIDYMKQINSASGFDITNEFLQILSEDLESSVRLSDTVARVYEDDFIVLLENFEGIPCIQPVIDKIMNIPKKTFMVQHHKINVSFNLGITVYPDDDVDTITMLSHASTAMQLSKSEGTNEYRFYTQELAQEAIENGKLEHELLKSVQNNKLELFYQLQYNPLNHKILGMEALPHLRHPTMGLLLADQFIALSEETGIVVAIDSWVLKESIAQFKKYHESGLDVASLSINVSMMSLTQDSFLAEVKTVLLENEYMKDCLYFEVAEHTLMQNPKQSIERLAKFSALGVKFSINDFGSDRTSLKSLQKLPISKLKLNRSLIADITRDEKNKEIVKTITAIAKSMNFDMSAQGVETQEEHDFLLENNCFEMQGCFFHKPLSSDELYKELQ